MRDMVYAKMDALSVGMWRMSGLLPFMMVAEGCNDGGFEYGL